MNMSYLRDDRWESGFVRSSIAIDSIDGWELQLFVSTRTCPQRIGDVKSFGLLAQAWWLLDRSKAGLKVGMAKQIKFQKRNRY